MKTQSTFIRFSQIMFIAGGCILLFGSAAWFPAYYKPRFMALVSFLYSFFIELPVILFRLPDGDAADVKEKLFFRGQFQFALACGLFVCGLGSLGLWGLYRVGIPYDKFVHVAFTAIVVISGIYFFKAWYRWSLRKTIYIVIAIIAGGSIAWEFVEFSFDRLWHLGFFGQIFDHDSVFDILSGFLGIFMGSMIVIWQHWLEKRS